MFFTLTASTGTLETREMLLSVLSRCSSSSSALRREDTGQKVPDQRVSFVDQYDQLIQQQLLSSLLGLRLLPVCNHTTGTNYFRTGDTEDCFYSKNLETFVTWMKEGPPQGPTGSRWDPNPNPLSLSLEGRALAPPGAQISAWRPWLHIHNTGAALLPPSPPKLTPKHCSACPVKLQWVSEGCEEKEGLGMGAVV
ncbi:hypothetical protein FQN60_014729, partial [Etheostoma spectabile]